VTFNPSSASAAPPDPATPDLSSIVLSQTLPSLLATSPGPTNGPITNSNASLLGRTSSETAAVEREIASGYLEGYVRVWSSPDPHVVDTVAILALNLRDSNQVSGFFAGFNHGISSVATGSFPVPGIAGASGFSERLQVYGEPATENIVTFARGDAVFDVETVTVAGTITLADTLSIAADQDAVAPGPSRFPIASSSTTSDPMLQVSSVIGGVVFWMLVILVVLYFVQRHRRRTRALLAEVGKPTSLGQAGWAGQQSFINEQLGVGEGTAWGLPLLPTFAPSPPPTFPAGWYPDSTDPVLQRYFDGNAWTNFTAPR
jgi:hypothetical protein